MLAGRLVRPNGTVLGIERSAESVALATKRATAAANIAVRFEKGDLNTYEPSVNFDALIGRSVLPYLADPPGVLRRLASHVRPGGVIVFIEFDVTCIASVPEAPLLTSVANWITRAYEGGGIDPALGSSLGTQPVAVLANTLAHQIVDPTLNELAIEQLEISRQPEDLLNLVASTRDPNTLCAGTKFGLLRSEDAHAIDVLADATTSERRSFPSCASRVGMRVGDREEASRKAGDNNNK